MMRSRFRCLVPVLFCALATPILDASSADASSIALFVQAPYEFSTGEFDLDNLEHQNTDPIFSQEFAVPYDDIEQLGKAMLAELTQEPLTGHEQCGADVVDIICPDADWSVTFDADFGFSDRREPVLEPYGSAADNGLRVSLQTEVTVNVTAHVHIGTSVQDADFDVPMMARLGVKAASAVTLYPVLSAQETKVELEWRGGNVDIVGLDGQVIMDGAIIGTALGFTPLGSLIGGPVGSGILGAVSGKVAIEAAKAKVKELFDQKGKSAVEASGALITQTINNLLQPAIAQANDLVSSIRNQPIPGIDRTYGELEALFGMSLDVRSVANDKMFRSVVTSRFNNTPAATEIQGFLQFPKTVCEYSEGGGLLTGRYLWPVGVRNVNEELIGESCASLVGLGLAHRAYYGESPERSLKSGDPVNELLTWGPLGSLEPMGEAFDAGETIVCPYTISNLPAASIFEVGTVPGSTLAYRLASRQFNALTDGSSLIGDRVARSQKFQKRILVLDEGGLTLALDHQGNLLNPFQVDLGEAGPAGIEDCPSIELASGTGLSQSELEGIRDSLDPETCPWCGVEANPFEDSMLPAIYAAGEATFHAGGVPLMVDEIVRSAYEPASIRLEAPNMSRLKGAPMNRMILRQ